MFRLGLPMTLNALVRFVLACSVAAAPMAAATPASAASRIKDLADIEGVRTNMLLGYGLVVGLQGTGDSLRNSPQTLQSLQAMLERLGVNTRGANLSSGNIAAVTVTAELPAFATQGSRFDISVQAIGDAKSLLGGTLIATPLLGADGNTYAVAQGAISVAGFAAQGAGASVVKGVPTNGRIAAGAVVEREVGFRLANQNSLRLALRNPDFTTAKRMAEAINAFVGNGAADAPDPATVRITVPNGYRGGIVGLLTEIEQLRVRPDAPAKIVIDETSGIIVMGEDVRVSTVAIAQGNLTIRITEEPEVAQPAPFSDGETVVVPRTEIKVSEQADRKLTVMRGGVSLQQLVGGLNALGVGPRDLIAILQAIKAAGALQADIEVI
jgi:flagellar P-ring protein precursor FlgI